MPFCPYQSLLWVGRAGVVEDERAKVHAVEETISFAEPAHRRKQVLGRPYERDASYRRSDSYLIMYAYTRARVQSFYVFAFTSSPFGCKVLIKCELRVKVSPFCLHLFFAIDVVQRVVFQLVAVKVKVNAGFAFTLNRLIYSLLWGEVKGEGKNGKFAESASAYIRVGACPARRVKWILCGVGRF